MSIDHIISEINDWRIEKIILIGGNTTLLDFGHKFMGSLHVVDSKDEHIGFDGYIGNLILRIYGDILGHISGYFGTKYKKKLSKLMKILEKTSNTWFNIQ